MKGLIQLAMILVLAACGNSDEQDSDDTDQQGACGEVTVHSLNVSGLVLMSDGSAVGASGVTVSLEDRGWNPGEVLAQVQTNEDGEFLLAEAAVTSVVDCWGTLLNYVVVAESALGRAEKEVNTALFNAIRDGESTVDLRDVPLLLEN